MEALLSRIGPEPGGSGLGIAVSGGGDSTALLILSADWARARGVALQAVTVDHGLRPAAAAEAESVARLCAALDVPHAILRWQDREGRGNLMQRARQARQALIAGWAAERGLRAVALGHTMEDQAETLLLNLARGSGVDGLSAMPDLRRDGGLIWLRPLLGQRREALRGLLRARGIGWAEDPSNDDPRFDRVRLRQAIPALGLDVPRLAATARRMQEARAVLEEVAAAAAGRLCRLSGGDLLVDPAIRTEPAEIRGRILSRALAWIGGGGLRPRRDDLSRLEARLAEGAGGTLAGCLVTMGDAIRIAPEPARVGPLTAVPPGPWDGRWRFHAAEKWPGGALIRALGEAGLAQRPGWRGAGLPRASALTLPALWVAGRPVFAAHLDPAGPFRAEVDTTGFFCLGKAH